MAFVFGDSSSRNDGDIGDDVSKRVGITKAAEKALTKDIMTEDGFVNFTAKLGLGSENLTSYSQYGMSNILSRDRQRLEIMYRHSWLVGQVVDTIAEDMTKEGIELYSDMSPDDSQAIMKQFARLSIWESIADNIKWGRLYGGSIAVILTEGADYEQPLNIQRIGKGKFKGLKVFDRWQVEPSLSDLITECCPEMGSPKYYTIMPGMETMGGQKIHYTRVIRYDGIKMPYNQKRFDNQWGMSVVERMFDRLLAFDSATTGAAQLMYKAYLRTVGVKGLRQALAMGGKTEQAVIKQFQYIRLMQSLEGITLLDSEDSFQTHTYSFGGVADVLQEFAQQISGATNIPLVRLFGQSPRGFSTGDTDLRNYYDNISKLQNGQLRNDVYRLVEVLSMSVLGNPLPKDFDFKFKPLYAMDSVQKSQIAATNANTINSAFQSGLITKKIGMKELAQQSAETGMFTNIDDEDIKNAVEESPEHQGEFGNEEPLPAEELEKKLETEASSPDTDQVNSLSEQALESPDDLTRLSGELESLDAPNLEQLERELKSLDDTTFEELEATLKAIRIGESSIEEIDKFKGKVSSTTLEALEQQLSEILIEAPPKKMTMDVGIGDLFKKIWKAVKAYTSDAERLRAPKGGVSLKSKFFKGGEFIPAEGGYAAEYKKQQKKKPEPEKESSKSARLDKAKLTALKNNLGIQRRAHVETILNAPISQQKKLAIEDIQQTAMVDEERASMMYDGVSYYSDGGYSEIRKHPESNEAILIEEFIEKSPKWDNSKPLVRGLNVDKSFISKLKPGKSIDMQGLSSWSSDADEAKQFAEFGFAEGFVSPDNIDANRVKVILRLSHSDKAVAVSHLSENPHEEEVLLSSKAKLVVESYKKSGDYFIVDLKEITGKAKDKVFDSANILMIDKKILGKQIALLTKWENDSDLIKIEGEIKTQDAERLRAPKGGVSIKGKEFQGGEFIPTEGGYAEEYKKTLTGKKKEAEKETAKPAAKAKPALKVNQEKINALKQKIAKQSSEGIKRTKQTENFVHAKRNEAGEFVFEGNNKLPKHLEGFAIAPAYKHILVNPDPKANRWLIGFDESGQKVIGNIYSPEYEKKRLLRKDAMVHDLNKNIEIIHKELDTDIETKDLSNRQKAIIAKVMVITGARVGSSEKALGAKGKTYGAATLEGRHIIEQEDGTVKLKFIGKDSKLNEYDVPDKRIARILIKLKKKAGEEGRLFDEKYQRILNYVKQLDGGDYTPHNFRTKIGTDTAIETIESMPVPKNAKEYKKALAKVSKVVAKRLCNTPAVALKKYIMPSVWANWKTQAGIE